MTANAVAAPMVGYLAVAPELFYWGGRAKRLWSRIRGWRPLGDLDATPGLNRGIGLTARQAAG